MSFLRLVLLSAATLSALPALAEDRLIVADCAGGECRCVLSSLTPNEMAVVLGTDLPAGATGVILREDAAPDWLMSSVGDAEIALGGDGVCETELFEDWVPENGVWDGRTALTGASGRAECSMMATMMLGMMNQAPGPVTVDWGGAFDMQRFWAASNPTGDTDRPVWTPVDFRTVTGQGGGEGMVTAYTARLISPVRFVLDTRISGEGCVFDMRTTARKVG